MDPISFSYFLGAAGAGGVPIEGFTFIDSTRTSPGVSLQLSIDNSGNTYVNTPERYFKVSNASLIWQKSMPGIMADYSGTISKIGVSPNGTYLAIVGTGGSLGVFSTGAELTIVKINPSDGTALQAYCNSSNLPNPYPYANDVLVDDDGICDLVGAHYRVFDAPYLEWVIFGCNLTTNSTYSNGYKGSTYFDSWYTASGRGIYRLVAGVNAANGTPGYGNLTLFSRGSASPFWTKDYIINNNSQTNTSINSAAIDGVGDGYAAFSGPLGSNYILKVANSDGSPIFLREISAPGQDSRPGITRTLSIGSNRICFAGNVAIGGVSRYFIAAIDTSGTILWSKQIIRNGVSLNSNSLAYAPTFDRIAVGINLGSSGPENGKGACIYLPADGSASGVAGEFTVSDFPLTIASSVDSVSTTNATFYNIYSSRLPSSTTVSTSAITSVISI